MPQNSFIPEVPPALREPSIFSQWLFEDPTYLLAIIAAIGALAAWQLWRTTRARAASLAFVITIALCTAIWLISSSITTPRERIVAATWSLIRTTTAADVDALSPLLADRARLDNTRGSLNMDKPSILARVKATLGGPFKLKDWAVVRMQAAADNENKGQSQFYIRVTPEITGAPDLSWWRITWQREGDAWKVALIEPMSGTAIDTLR